MQMPGRGAGPRTRGTNVGGEAVRRIEVAGGDRDVVKGHEMLLADSVRTELRTVGRHRITGSLGA